LLTNFHKLAIDLDLLAEEVALLGDGKPDAEGLVHLALAVDDWLHPFAQRVAALSIDETSEEAVRVAEAFMGDSGSDGDEADAVDPARIAEVLDEIQRSNSPGVHMFTLTTGETLWGKLTAIDGASVRVDTGRGERTLDISTVSGVYFEDVSRGPE
jgi:hypothetical protein